jgi:hypothetical protein
LLGQALLTRGLQQGLHTPASQTNHFQRFSISPVAALRTANP